MLDADEQLAALPLPERVRLLRRAINHEGTDEDTRAALLSVALWPMGAPPLTPERRQLLTADAWMGTRQWERRRALA